MTAALRMEMARLIHKHYDDFDGFVVIHGTDTMVDTAAALCYMLQDLGKPVVLDRCPASYLRSRSRRIEQPLLFGALCFHGYRRGGHLFRGSHTAGKPQYEENVHGFNAFQSFRVPALGELGVSVRLDDHRLMRREGALRVLSRPGSRSALSAHQFGKQPFRAGQHCLFAGTEGPCHWRFRFRESARRRDYRPQAHYRKKYPRACDYQLS